MHWPVTSLITHPRADRGGSDAAATVKMCGTEFLDVEGIAYSGGQASDAAIQAVEVSGDGGNSWTNAALRPGPSGFAWTLWSARVPLRTVVQATGHERGVVTCRARTAAGHTQPEEVEEVLRRHPGGYLHNARHSVIVEVAD